jgi:hypothetical protein
VHVLLATRNPRAGQPVCPAERRPEDVGSARTGVKRFLKKNLPQLTKAYCYTPIWLFNERSAVAIGDSMATLGQKISMPPETKNDVIALP